MLNVFLRVVSIILMLLSGIQPSFARHATWEGDMRFKLCFFNEGRPIPVTERISYGFTIYSVEPSHASFCEDNWTDVDAKYQSTNSTHIPGNIDTDFAQCIDLAGNPNNNESPWFQDQNFTYNVNVIEDGSVRGYIGGLASGDPTRYFGWGFNGLGPTNDWAHNISSYQSTCASRGRPIPDFFDNQSLTMCWQTGGCPDSDINATYLSSSRTFSADDPYHALITVFDILTGYEPLDLGDAPDTAYSATTPLSYSTYLNAWLDSAGVPAYMGSSPYTGSSVPAPAHALKDEDNNNIQDLRIGPCWDPESSNLPQSGAKQDDIATATGSRNNVFDRWANCGNQSDENDGGITFSSQNINSDVLTFDNLNIDYTLTVGDTYDVVIDVYFDTAVASNNNHLEVRIDFDRDGVFENVLVDNNVDLIGQSSPHPVNLGSIHIPISAYTRDDEPVYMRVRVCDDNCFDVNYDAPNGQPYQVLTPTGIQPSGEIEDYALYLRSPYDLGDAPFDTDITGPADFAPGVTTVPNAVHTLIGSGEFRANQPDYNQPALMLGECWDSEESISVSPNLNADIDDTTEAPTSSNYPYYKYDNPNANCTSDEEGVQFPRYFTPGKEEIISFNYRVNSEDAMTVVWAIFADWDNDQNFSTAIDTGTITLTAAEAQQNIERPLAARVNVPTDAVHNYSYLRVRICIQDNTYTCTNATGRALGGEVEDYKINVQQSEYDYGDAPDADPTTTGKGDYETQGSNGASHQRVDLNFDSNIDLRLGSTWDSDDGTQQNPTATADGSDDGVTFLGHGAVPTVAPGDLLLIEVDIQRDSNAFTTDDIYLYGWIDFNRDGDWDDAGEQVLSEDNTANVSLIFGTNSFPVQIPGNNVVYGYSFLRLRVCDSSACNSPNGEVNIGEVEDYRILFSNLSSNFQNGINANCNSVFQLRSETRTSGPFLLETIDLTSNPIAQSALQNPISVPGQTDINHFDSIGYDRRTGYIYGTFSRLDTTNSTITLHLFQTDSSATNFIDLGPIYAESDMDIRLTSGQLITINQGDPYTYPFNTPRNPQAGVISTDYQYLYLWNQSWESIVKVNISTQEMTVLDLSFNGFTSLLASSDLAVDFNNDVIYAVSLTLKRLYTINSNTGDVTAIPIDFPGMADPEIDDNGNLNSQGIFMDDMTHLYVFSNGGHHDSNNDNQRDLRNTSALYKINVHSGIATFEKSSSSSVQHYSDLAGCYQSKDFSDGDSRYPIASHYYVDDSSGLGRSNLSLGSSVDTEIEAKASSTAKGDDNHGLADEDLVIPATINVNEVTNMTFSLDTGANGYLNVWVDANHDYDFDDLGEHKLNDRIIFSGGTAINFNIIIDDSETDGYSGETTMRIRLCSSQNECNSPSGEASSGEVEDHVFELLNRIIINGYVFEDNGVPSGTAHDGIKGSSEKGLKDFDVKIISNDSSIVGFPMGDTISTQTTRGDGYYEFSFEIDYSGKNLRLNVVPQEKWIDVSEVDVSAINEVTNTSNQDSEMSVIATVGDILTGLNFGKVAVPTLTESGFKEAEPGKTVSFPHRFKLETSADVTFLIDNDPRYPNTGWGVGLFEDTNCDGVLTPPGELRMAANVTYSGITDICLINRVFVASGAPLNRQLTYKISANVDLLGVNPPISRQVVVEDTTRVTYRGTGDLSLSLTVNNVLKNNTELLMNEAEPGDILKYTVMYENSGTTPISDIVIYEYIQSPTKLYTPIDCTYSLPPSIYSSYINSLNCALDIPVNADNIADYQGEIQWTLSGTLQPGEKGALSYVVIIE